jgi:hypothetical protein
MAEFLNMARILLLTFLILAGCDKQAMDAKDAVKRQLKDPNSVEFRDVESYENGVTCGRYNAKNGYGAYSGFQGFVYDKGVVALQSDKEYTSARDKCTVGMGCDPEKLKEIESKVISGVRAEDIPDSMFKDACN